MDMFNLSLLNSSLSPIAKTPSLDQLLDLLGFSTWMTITASFVLPTINFIGIILCSLSAWIFFDKKFVCILFCFFLENMIPFFDYSVFSLWNDSKKEIGSFAPKK